MNPSWRRVARALAQSCCHHHHKHQSSAHERSSTALKCTYLTRTCVARPSNPCKAANAVSCIILYQSCIAMPSNQHCPSCHRSIAKDGNPNVLRVSNLISRLILQNNHCHRGNLDPGIHKNGCKSMLAWNLLRRCRLKGHNNMENLRKFKRV